MAQNKYLQLLRNSAVAASYEAAVEAINGKATALADGTPIVVRFTETVGETSQVRALLGVAYSQGETKIISYVELGGERISDVKTALTTAISNAKTELQNSINGVSEALTNAKNDLQGQINQINTNIENKNVDAEGETGDAALVTASASGNKVTVASTTKLQAAVAKAETALQVADKTELSNAIAKEVEDREAAVQTLTEGLKAVTDDYLTSANKTELEGKITDAINASKVTITPSDVEGLLKRYTFTQNNETIGTIDLAKDLVVTGGEIVEKEGVKYLQLSIANQETPVEIAVSDLVDVYTGSTYVTIGTDNTISVNFDVLDAALAAETTTIGAKIKANADAIAQEVKDRTDAVKEVSDGLKAVTDDYLKSADKTELSNAIAKEVEDRTAAVKTVSDELANSLNGVVAGDYINVTDKASKSQTISVKVSADETNVIEGKDGSLYVSNVWDCGTF